MNGENNKKGMYPVGGTAKRTAMGSFWMFFGHAIKALEQVIFIPLFLWAWGKALYGEWMTLFSIVGYLSVSDFGMGNYVGNKMTQAYSRGDMKEYAKVFKSAFGIFSIISAILFVALAAFSFYAPFLKWFNIEIASSSSVRLSLLILGTYLILSNLLSLISGLYSTTGEFSRGRIFSNIKQILLIGFVALALFLGGRFISVALIYFAVFIAFIAFIAFDVFRRHKEINLSEARIDWRLARNFVAPGLVFMLIPLSNLIYIQGSVLVISYFLGSVAVSVFVVHRTLANLVQRFTGTISPAIAPELTAGEERKEYAKIQLIHRFFTKIYLFVSISLATVLLFVGEEVMQLWTGGEIVFDSNLWILFLILIPVLAFWNFSALFQIATNKYNKLALSRIISTVSGLVLAIILVKPLGLFGVVLAFLISEVLIDLWYIPYNTLEIIKGSKKNFIVPVLGVLPLIALQLVAGWLVSGLFGNIWLKVIFVGLVIAAIGALHIYFLWFNKEEKNIVDVFIGKTVKKVIRWKHDLKGKKNS